MMSGAAGEEMAVTKAAADCWVACFTCSLPALPALPCHNNQLTLTVTHSQSKPRFQCEIRQTSASWNLLHLLQCQFQFRLLPKFGWMPGHIWWEKAEVENANWCSRLSFKLNCHDWVALLGNLTTHWSARRQRQELRLQESVQAPRWLRSPCPPRWSASPSGPLTSWQRPRPTQQSPSKQDCGGDGGGDDNDNDDDDEDSLPVCQCWTGKAGRGLVSCRSYDRPEIVIIWSSFQLIIVKLVMITMILSFMIIWCAW